MMKLSKILIFLLVLLGVCPARATITRTQLVGNTAASATSLPVTTAGTVIGHLIVAELSSQQGASALGISDNAGNTYTQFPTVFTGTNIWANNHASKDAIWYTIDAFGGVTTVTMTSPSTGDLFGVVGEYASTNGWPANPTDKFGAPNDATSTNWTSGTSSTTTRASELLWGAVVFLSATPGTITPAAGWGTGVQQTIGSRTLYFDDRFVAATSTYAFSGTSGNSQEFGAVLVTFFDNLAPSGSRFVRLPSPEHEFDVSHWAITDRERKRA